MPEIWNIYFQRSSLDICPFKITWSQISPRREGLHPRPHVDLTGHDGPPRYSCQPSTYRLLVIIAILNFFPFIR